MCVCVCVHISHIDADVPDLTRQIKVIIIIKFISLSPLSESKFLKKKNLHYLVHLHILITQKTIWFIVCI